MSRTYEEHMINNVISTLTIADDGEIRYSVTQDGVVLYNEAITGKYSTQLAARLAREQHEVATRYAR